jgi:hypothetical protein
MLTTNNSFNNETLRHLDLIGIKPDDRVYFRTIPASGSIPDDVLLQNNLAYRNRKAKNKVCYSSYDFYYENGNLFFLDKFTSSIHEVTVDLLNQYANLGSGVYIQMNPAKGKTIKDVYTAYTLFFESDNLSLEEQWRRIRELESKLGCKANIIFTGGKSLHVSFRLTVPLTDLSEWRNLQKRLISYFGYVKINDIQKTVADTSIKNENRLMRLAGFNNPKWNENKIEFKPVQILQEYEGTVDLLTLDRVLPLELLTEVKDKNDRPQFNKPQANLNKGNELFSNNDFNGPSFLEFGPFLPSWNPEGRKGWATCQCEVHTQDDPSQHTEDSVHVDITTGKFKAHCECPGGQVYKLALIKALRNGYVPPEKYMQMPEKDSKEIFKAKTQVIYQKQRGLNKYQPHVILDQPNLIIPDLKPGLTFISSACKTGKTTGIISWIARHPGTKVHFMTYRNALLWQSLSRANGTHIHQLNQDRDKIANEKRLGYCPDSAHLINISAIEPGMIFVIDECDATMKHMMEGGTLKDQQEMKLIQIKAIIRKILELGGYVICMEDSITDLTIDSYRDIAGMNQPYGLIVNQAKKSFFKGVIGAGSPSGQAKHIFNFLGKGNKAILVSDSQAYLEKIDWINRNSGGTFNFLRVDKKTSEDEEVKSFLKDPNGFLKENDYDLVLISPTAEAGVSIEIPGFNRVYGYFVHSEPRAMIQMLERYRLDSNQGVDRFIYCNKFAMGANKIKTTDPVELAAKLDKQRQATIEATKLLDTLQKMEQDNGLDGFFNLTTSDKDENNRIFNMAYAGYKCREVAAKTCLLENLRTELIERGHELTDIKWEHDTDLCEELKIAKDEIEISDAVEFIEADENRYSVDEARKVVNKYNNERQDWLDAHKTLTVNDLPGYDFTQVDSVRYIIGKRGKTRKRDQNFFLMYHPELGHKEDKNYLLKKYLADTFVMNHRIQHKYNRGLILSQFTTYVDWCLENQYTEVSPVIINFNALLVEKADVIQEVLGIEIRTLQPQLKDQSGKIVQQPVTAVMNVNKLLLALGLKAVRKGREGAANEGNSKRNWIYEISNKDCPYRQMHLEALTRFNYPSESTDSSETSTKYIPLVSNTNRGRLDSQLKQWLASKPGATMQSVSEATKESNKAIFDPSKN